jgi:hypothetical protein
MIRSKEHTGDRQSSVIVPDAYTARISETTQHMLLLLAQPASDVAPVAAGMVQVESKFADTAPAQSALRSDELHALLLAPHEQDDARLLGSWVSGYVGTERTHEHWVSNSGVIIPHGVRLALARHHMIHAVRKHIPHFVGVYEVGI